MPIMNDTNYPEITTPTGEEVLYVSGKQSIKVKTIKKYGGSYTAADDPAINAAVSTAIVDAYSGVIITTTAAGNAQTIQDPTTSADIRNFTVINRSDSTHSITVNGLAIEPGKSQLFTWDGAAWSVGLKGEKGDTGEQGIQGIQGVQGEKGDKGDQGDPGANCLYGTGDPPDPSGYADGTLWVKYVG